MSVQSATTRNDYTAGASQTVYAYTFEIKAASDITVIVGGVTKSLNTDYTVSGVGTNSGGNVTLSAAPASGTTVSLVMEMDLARDTDYQANGAFLADDVNNDFDSLWLATNQQETELGRSLRLNQTEPTSDMTLPLKDARKGSVLAFNETTGLPVAGPTIANVDSVAGITGDIATVADNDANITTVAGISGDVTSVANISANVTTVAGNTTNINAVAADASDIGTVASNISNVNTTAGISSDVTTVAGNNVNITTVAGDSSEITTVAGVASDVSTVSGIASDVTAVAGDASDIGTVASSISNVNAVGTNITNVNNVAGNASNINTVAADGTDIGTVAGISANVTTVAGISSDVTTVAGLETKMDTVIADASDIGTVAGISASVTTVANNSSNVTTVAGLETKMDTIIADAADIGAVATNINSVTTVSGISGDVTTVASKASDVETVADNIGDVQAASQNATNAAASAQAAASSASTAGTHATNASASASQAANSATGADDSEAAAGISASAASSSASAASSSASSAASSASDANDSQAAAALSASGASVSASAAAVSAGNSETAAATWNNFYTTYLGAAASAPSTDLLGQPLQDGALYFNTTDDTMYVFNGSIWIAAESTINIVSVPTQLAADLTTNGNDIIFGDNDKAKFGAGDDLQIYHDGFNTLIKESGAGSLLIDATNTYFRNAAGTKDYAWMVDGGAVSLFYNNSNKLATTSTGIDVTGSVVADGLTVNANTATFSAGTSGDMKLVLEADTDNNEEGDTPKIQFKMDGGATFGHVGFVGTDGDLFTGSTANSLALGTDVNTRVQFYSNNILRQQISNNGDISFYEDTGTTPKLTWDASAESLNFADNGKATFGASDDLQIFHTGSYSAIKDVGTGALFIGGDNYVDIGNGNLSQTRARFYDSTVELRSGGLTKLATTSTGIDVTGNVVADGLTVDGDTDLGSATRGVSFRTSGTGSYKLSGGNSAASAAAFIIDAKAIDTADLYLATDGVNHLKVAQNGDISFYEDTGTTPKFFWDASAEELEIGTSTDKLELGDSYYRFRKGNQNKILVGNTASALGSGTGLINYLYDAEPFIWWQGTERMRIDSTGRVGIGTSSPAATLHVDASSPEFRLAQSGTAKVRFRTSGDNYINTGHNLGIGTSSPVAPLTVGSVSTDNFYSVARESAVVAGTDVTVSNTQTGILDILSTSKAGLGKSTSLTFSANSSKFVNGYDKVIGAIDVELISSTNTGTDSAMKFYTSVGAGTSSSLNEAMRIDSSGNVGVGTTDPNEPLTVSGNTLTYGSTGNVGSGVSLFFGNNSNSRDIALTRVASGSLGIGRYSGGWQETARFDASGNLLVGKSATGLSTDGTELAQGGTAGKVQITRTSNAALLLNRRSTDGTIADFRKDGTTVGSIGNSGVNLMIGKSDTGLGFSSSANAVFPIDTSTGSNRSSAIDLGASTARFKDLYLSGGVYLGGTGSANKLDDYEEGTFNITVNGDATGVISAQTGNYVKIGKVVHIDCAFVVSTNFTSSSVGGLPFTPSIATNASSLRPLSILVNNAQDVSARTANGSTTISFGEVSNGTAHEPDTSSGVYRISGSYTTA